MRRLLALVLGHKVGTVVLIVVLSVGAAASAVAAQETLSPRTTDTTSAQVTGSAGATDEQQGAVENSDEDNESGQRDVVGIPKDNPVHQPAVTPEACEKGETIVRATPSGQQVRVPCQAVREEDADDEAEQGESGQRDVVGIPKDNPVHQPAATPEACEKGETVIKTTPSGKQVNVPCQAVKEHGPKGDDAGDETEDQEGTE